MESNQKSRGMGRRCPRCHTFNSTGARFCAKCHELLHVSAHILSTGRLIPNFILHERYKIISLLGIGGMGAVYKAIDLRSGDRIVAIKEMSKAKFTPQEAEIRFKNEALILEKLHHPHLPHIYDYFLHRTHWYLTMDFIEGETLHWYLYKTMNAHISTEEVVDFGIQLCNVLNYLHTRQHPIIFRDLKPSNIMRTPKGHLFLIDFGIARHFKVGQANDTSPLGTFGYSAPELSWQQSDTLSDIYSLGVTLHELLTGINPGQKSSNFVDLYTFDYSIPSSLSKLIMSMLHRDRNKRPGSAAIIEQELHKISHQLSSKKPRFSQSKAYPIHRHTGLYIEEGFNQGKFYELKSTNISIGRGKQSYVFLEDTYVSRSHATVVYLGNKNYALRDEDSANGTVLNGKRLKPHRLYFLENGDRIQISETKFVFMQ